MNNDKKRNSLTALMLGLMVVLFAGAAVYFGLSVLKEKKTPEPAQVIYIEREPVSDKRQEAEYKEVSDADFNIGRRYSDVFVQGNDLKDNYGNTYLSAYKVLASDKEMRISLDGTYAYLKGSFALSYEDSGADFNYARVTVYDENGNRIYVSRDISQKDPKPIDLLVDVSGCSMVRVEIEGYDRYVIPVTLISKGLFLSNEAGI